MTMFTIVILAESNSRLIAVITNHSTTSLHFDGRIKLTATSIFREFFFNYRKLTLSTGAFSWKNLSIADCSRRNQVPRNRQSHSVWRPLYVINRNEFDCISIRCESNAPQADFIDLNFDVFSINFVANNPLLLHIRRFAALIVTCCNYD